MKPLKIIALDFDDTLCIGGWPVTNGGRLNTDLYVKMLTEIRENNAVFILWTCRDGVAMEEAKAWISEKGLPIYLFNEQHPSTKEWLAGYESRKIFAHEYWDDRAVRITV